MVKLTESGYTVSIMDNLMNSSEKATKRVEEHLLLSRSWGRLKELTGIDVPFFKIDMCDPPGQEVF